MTILRRIPPHRNSSPQVANLRDGPRDRWGSRPFSSRRRWRFHHRRYFWAHRYARHHLSARARAPLIQHTQCELRPFGRWWSFPRTVIQCQWTILRHRCNVRTRAYCVLAPTWRTRTMAYTHHVVHAPCIRTMSMFHVPCSMYHVPCTMYHVPCCTRVHTVSTHHVVLHV